MVSDKGTPLKYFINESMMRIDLPQPLKPGKKVVFSIDWHYYMIDRMKTPSWGRGGYEYFEDNNFFTRPFYIQTDVIPPVLKITFDEMEVVDGDFQAAATGFDFVDELSHLEDVG